MRATLLSILSAAGLAATAAYGAAPFTPNTIAGTWNGTWRNETFGSTGPARIVAKSLAGNTKLMFSLTFGGNVFGCPSVPPESSPALTKGTGPNHWSATGFIVKGASKDFGSLTLTDKNGKLTGSGRNPPCQAGLSWTISGTFTNKSFTGKVVITLPSAAVAISDLALTRA